MIKTIFRFLPVFWLLFVCIACTEENTHSINGMWQLKTVQDESGGAISTVDTIFFAFQRSVIFSYTIIYEEEGEPATTEIIYGYDDFSSGNKLHILIDDNYDWRIPLLFWNSKEVTFDVLEMTTRKLTLRWDGKVYKFDKF